MLKTMIPTNSFRQTRNIQVAQQAVLLGLINKHFSFVLNPPKKKSVVAQQILVINSLNLNEEVIEVENFVQKRLKEIEEHNVRIGINLKTAARRGESNRISEGNHLLMDFLREIGYVFITSLSEGKNGTTKVETFYSVMSNGKHLFSRSTLIQKGLLINQYLTDSLDDKQPIFIEKNNAVINQLLCKENNH